MKGGVDADFSMVTLLDDYAIYSDSNGFKVALKRIPGDIYARGARLPQGYYRILQVAEFKTTQGTNEQIPAIERLK